MEEREVRSLLLNPTAICGQKKENREPSDFPRLFILSWRIVLLLKSILVSTMCGKYLLTEETNSSAVLGSEPINLLYT